MILINTKNDEIDQIIDNEVDINKEIIVKALSFDYKSILKISQSTTFTKLN